MRFHTGLSSRAQPNGQSSFAAVGVAALSFAIADATISGLRMRALTHQSGEIRASEILASVVSVQTQRPNQTLQPTPSRLVSSGFHD